MAFHVPYEEQLAPDELAMLQRRRLADLLARAVPGNAFYSSKFRDLTFNALSDPIESLPFTTRDDLQRDQKENPPYGSNLSFPRDRFTRFHQTSGSLGNPLRWLDTTESWQWLKRCWCIIFRAANLKSSDSVMFPFSFGPFIGFWMAFEAAADLGNLVFPAGGMTTAARLDYLIENRVTFICCTPTYALRMAEVARDEGVDLRSSAVQALIVAGEPGGSIPSVRERIESSWEARVFDHSGMTEIGAWGLECLEAPAGLHVIETEFIAEVIDPDTGESLPDGKLGELVLTNLGRVGSPLLRYRTGDQVRLTRDRCACGRWFARAEGGVLGRIDDMLLIRGNNVFPSAIEAIVRESTEVAEFSLTTDGSGPMAQLRIAIEPVSETDANGLAEKISAKISDRLHFTARIELVQPGKLPRFEMKAKRVVRA